MHTLLSTTSSLFHEYLYRSQYQELEQRSKPESSIEKVQTQTLKLVVNKLRTKKLPVKGPSQPIVRFGMEEWQQQVAVPLSIGGQSPVLSLQQASGATSKVFSDPIHGLIELHPLMVKIIDTPQFQRLRSIKQLGGLCYVYTGANHNRFEHSIGAGYLAGNLVNSLREKDPDLNITDQDALSVKIAALCLGLGHGPFSNIFAKMVIPRIQRLKGDIRKWKLRECSAMMFDYLVKVNRLKPFIKHFYRFQSDRGVDAEIEFIKSLIRGEPRWRPTLQPDGTSQPCQQCHCMDYRREQEDKEFLYEIVANPLSGIDVDKWDYYQRDCHHMGLPGSFDVRRPLKLARVFHIEDEEKKLSRKLTCMMDKSSYDLYEMFHTRFSLQREAYHHPVVVAVEIMISDALVLANEHLKFQSKNGAEATMYDVVMEGDMYAYESVTDYITEQILFTDSAELEEARKILERIEKRDLYKCICDNVWDKDMDYTRDIADEILGGSKKKVAPAGGPQPNDIVVVVSSLDYGEEENPVSNVYFYVEGEAGKPHQILRNEAKPIPPHVLKDQRIRVYTRKIDPAMEAVIKSRFEIWYTKQHTATEEAGHFESPPAPKRPRRVPVPPRGVIEDDGPDGKPEPHKPSGATKANV